MRKLHLLCNAHLDPVWLWRRNEGMAEAISTFRVAADFCENYDGFIFNHNEAVLYEWVEEYEPELFERIKKLVKAGKWVIMGGWYIQPDCVMTSGESLMNQIALGNEYFMKKFGVKPTTAINFDPFGHSRGLVQILAKNGYNGYLYLRPAEFQGDYIWEGYDGSQVYAHGFYETYRTFKGDALNKLKGYLEKFKDKDTGLFLWGIGNHGGGPSKIDLEEINEFIKSSDTEIVHSTAEEFIADIEKNNPTVLKQSLVPCMVGCYTTMARIKQANRHLENKIAITEKIMSYADMLTDFSFDSEELNKAKKALAFCQFHDILPGTAIKPAEDDALMQFGYGEETADLLYNKAFFKLCEGQKKAKENEIPIMIFNPHPFEIEGEFEAGFLLQNQNWNDGEETIGFVYDENGNPLPAQNEKPDCTINLDWVKKISFTGKLAPSSVTRFDVKLEVVKKEEKSDTSEGDFIIVSGGNNTVRISKKTGLIDLYEVSGKSMLKNTGLLEVYNDNEDPWGMTVNSFTQFKDTFTLMSDEKANEFIGYPDEKISNVRVVEDGDVRTKIQAFFSYKRSVAVVEYTIPKTGKYIDVNVTMYSNEPNVMIKYRIDTTLSGKPYGDTAFGCEELFEDEREAVYHKWCGIKAENEGVYVLNDGIYGGSFTNSTIRLSLLRTPIYSAHPIGKRPIAPHNRFTNHIDMGERHFSFRIISDDNIPRQAQVYNQKPQVLSFFPSGDGNKTESAVIINNPDILLSSFKKVENGYKITLYNSADFDNDAELTIPALDKKLSLHFTKHELKIFDLNVGE